MRPRTFIAALSLTLATSAAVAADFFQFVTTDTFPPFSIVEDGKLSGPFPEVTLAVCAEIGASCQIEVLPTRRAMAKAEQGELDGILSLLKTTEREALFFFSEPVVDTAYGVFALTANPFLYREARDLSGQTIGVYGPSGTQSVLQETIKDLPAVQLQIELNNERLLQMLVSGRYGAKGLAVMNRDVGFYLMRRDGIEGLKEVGEIGKAQYFIAFSRKKVTPEKFERFNAGLKRLIERGTLDAILDKYAIGPAD